MWTINLTHTEGPTSFHDLTHSDFSSLKSSLWESVLEFNWILKKKFKSPFILNLPPKKYNWCCFPPFLFSRKILQWFLFHLLPTIQNILCETLSYCIPCLTCIILKNMRRWQPPSQGDCYHILLQVNRNIVDMVMRVPKYRARLLKVLDVFSTLWKTNVCIKKCLFLGIPPKRRMRKRES